MSESTNLEKAWKLHAAMCQRNKWSDAAVVANLIVELEQQVQACDAHKAQIQRLMAINKFLLRRCLELKALRETDNLMLQELPTQEK